MANSKKSASSKLIIAYGTAPNLKTAQKIIRILIEERLIACANTFPKIQSTYRWKGKIESGAEVAFLLKTRRSKWTALSKRFQALHPYETPCLIEFPVDRVLPSYAAWLLEETIN